MEIDKKQHTFTWYLMIFCIYAAGPAFFATTDPESLPLILLVFPFLWLFSVLLLTMMLILKHRTKATKRQALFISSLMAALFVLLAVFQSIHQLSLRDVLLATGIISLAAVYMLRADFIK